MSVNASFFFLSFFLGVFSSAFTPSFTSFFTLESSSFSFFFFLPFLFRDESSGQNLELSSIGKSSKKPKPILYPSSFSFLLVNFFKWPLSISSLLVIFFMYPSSNSFLFVCFFNKTSSISSLLLCFLGMSTSFTFVGTSTKVLLTDSTSCFFFFALLIFGCEITSSIFFTSFSFLLSELDLTS